MKSYIVFHAVWEINHPLCFMYLWCICYLPISHLVANFVQLTDIEAWFLMFKKLLFYLIMSPKGKGSYVGNSDMPRRSYKMLPSLEKVKVYQRNVRAGKKNTVHIEFGPIHDFRHPH